MTAIYRRPIVTPLNRTALVDAAYQAAGVEPPQQGAALNRLLQEAPTADVVAARMIREGYHADDLDTWHAQAVEAIGQALASERLRAAFGKVRPMIEAENAANLTDQAARDLTAPFNQAAKKLTEAARKLPEGRDPFNLEAVVAADAGAAYSTAREALAALSAYAGIHAAMPVQGRPVRWGELLGIVDVPETVTEQRGRLTRVPRNAPALGTTQAVREILVLIEKGDTDRALVDIARGKYEGFALKLASSEEFSARTERVVRALNYVVVDDA